MSKMFKKIVATGCSALLVMGIVIPASAAEVAEPVQNEHMQKVLEENKTYEGFMSSSDTLTFEEIASMPGSVVANEYDELQVLKKQPVSELYNLGMNSDEVEMIKTTSVKEMVLDNASTFSNKTLKEKGLDDETISDIRNGNYDSVTESEARLAAGQIAIGIGSVSRAGTSANYNIYWHWDVKPLQQWTDTLVGSIDNGYSTTVSSTAKVGYAPMGGTTADPSMEERVTPIRNQNQAIFDISMWNDTGSGWAVSGKAFVATKGSDLGALGPHAEYFHAWLSIPEITINWGVVSFPIDAGTKHTADGYIPAA